MRGRALKAPVGVGNSKTQLVSIPSVRGRALKVVTVPASGLAGTRFNPLCAGKGPEGSADPRPRTKLAQVSIPSVRGRALKDGGTPGRRAGARVSIPSVRGRALKAR